MIKADIHKVKDGEHKGTTSCSIEACGNAKEIISEVCMFIENIRESLDKADNPAASFAFRMAAIKAILDDSDDDDKDKKDGDKS